MLYPKRDRFPGFEVSNELKYDFHLAIKKAFGHAVDPAAAYEHLRRKLIRYFQSRGHNADAEYLADDAMDRVLTKVSDGYVQIENSNSVANFALGVARYISLEQHRTNQSSHSPTLPREDSFEERYYEALDSCLKKLKPNERKLLTKYYGEHRGETKRLAVELGISHQSLRVRTLRLRKRLREMMDQYLNDQ